MGMFWEQLADQGLRHAGFLMVALAYLLRDFLHLRLMALGAYSFFVGYQFTYGGPISWPIVGWYALFCAINAVQAAILWHERRLKHLTPEERRLYEIAFPALDVGAVRRLLRKGTWKTLRAGDCLTKKGEACPYVYALLEGSLRIEVEGCLIADGRPGQFVGEIGFLARIPATADAVVASDEARLLAWSRHDLEQMMLRSSELRSTVYAAFGRDLARKLVDHSMQAMGPEAAAAS